MVETAQAAERAEDSAQPKRKRIYVTSAQIAAAKLQMSIDRKFGYETQEIIKKIAAAK